MLSKTCLAIAKARFGSLNNVISFLEGRTKLQNATATTYLLITIMPKFSPVTACPILTYVMRKNTFGQVHNCNGLTRPLTCVSRLMPLFACFVQFLSSLYTRENHESA